MGTNSALITKKVIENSYEVLSIFLMSIIQGIDDIKSQDMMASFTKKIYDQLRNLVPVFIEDTTKYKEVALIKSFLMNHNLTLSDQ